ncbi:UNVERIFIED_ORG: hypothetical protein J2W19_003103 [Shinella zoogloeoides]|nr:hypothetical protein [Shinella zoogloeoides]
MARREQLARTDAVISISIALTVMEKFIRKFYARMGTKREIARGVDAEETWAITEIATVAAKRFSPFALYVDDEAHHWEFVRPTVRQAVMAVPMDVRIALAKGQETASREIAQRIFDAVDREFRLVPLKSSPQMHGKDPWEEIFQREHGHASQRKVP